MTLRLPLRRNRRAWSSAGSSNLPGNIAAFIVDVQGRYTAVLWWIDADHRVARLQREVHLPLVMDLDERLQTPNGYCWNGA